MVSVVTILALAYGLLGVLADMYAERVSSEQEVALFGSSLGPFPKIEAPSSEVETRFEKAKVLLGELVTADGLRFLPYRLQLIDFDEPNAFALPGGLIGLSPALFDWVKTKTGLAFVLAHELGHHHHRHVLKRIGRGLILILGGRLLAMLSGGGVSLDNMAELTLAQYSQDQEYQADAYAIELLRTLGFDLEQATEFLTRALESEGRGSGLGLWTSHPPTEARLLRLQRLVD